MKATEISYPSPEIRVIEFRTESPILGLSDGDPIPIPSSWDEFEMFDPFSF